MGGRGFYLILIVTFFEVCRAHTIRTLMPMPMTMVDTTMGSCNVAFEEPHCCSSADDLSALLLLARALEMDRAAVANQGVDVNGLLNTLVHALVYTACNCGCGSCRSSFGSNQTSLSNNSGSSTSGNSGSSGSSNPLIGLDVLGKNDLLDLNLGDKKILGIDLGSSNKNSTGGLDGVLSEVGDTVGGLLGSL